MLTNFTLTGLHALYWTAVHGRHPRVGTQIAHYCGNPWCFVHGVEVYWWINEEHKLCCWVVNINGEVSLVCNHVATQSCWPRPECVRFISF